LGAYTESDTQIRELEFHREARPSDIFAQGRVRIFKSAARAAVQVADRGLALVMLLLAIPVLAVAMALVAALSRKSPLVAHTRAGLGGKEIIVVKLRTMWGGPAAESRAGGLFIEMLRSEPAPPLKRPGDPRVTSAVAAFLRKHSIDELPQLWQVVKGDMALVGPRPIMSSELLEHYGPAASEVLRLKPGITGLWQVRGRSLLTYRQRRRLDLFLVRHWSFRLYCFILLATLPSVLTGRDAC
jgi:exopolysaccharide production protein ExoY